MYLDNTLQQILASIPDDRAALLARVELCQLYSAFGFLDRYFEILFELGVNNDGWGDSEIPIYESTIDRESGFTGHSRYLEIAKTWGYFELWDERGPPDMCEKLDGQWVCE